MSGGYAASSGTGEERSAGADWRHSASCRDQDPELFFASSRIRGGQRRLARARAICDGCPVRSACLTWALGVDRLVGIWGGLDEEEREVQRRLRARRKARAEAHPGARGDLYREGDSQPPAA